MNMIEKVARVIAIVDTGELNYDWTAYADLARAAIEALREPTEEMINAKDKHGDALVFWDYNCNTCGGAAQSWRAMIDAALSEPVTSPTSSDVSA